MGLARPFRFGVFGETARSREALLDTARRAEDSGYATFPRKRMGRCIRRAGAREDRAYCGPPRRPVIGREIPMPILKITESQVVSYDEYGAGPGLMLVHGSPGSSNAWQPVGQRLSDRFRIAAPNLPGYGGTSLEEPGGPEGV